MKLILRNKTKEKKISFDLILFSFLFQVRIYFLVGRAHTEATQTFPQEYESSGKKEQIPMNWYKTKHFLVMFDHIYKKNMTYVF